MKKTHVLLSILMAILMIAFLLRPERYLISARDGLLVFAVNVLPASFPFFFFTKMLTSLGAIMQLSKKTGNWIKPFHVPIESSYIVLVGLFSGYPIGAKLIGNFYHADKINTQHAKNLTSFCCVCGPIFLLGTLGNSILHSQTAGMLLLASQLIGAMLNGLLFCKKQTPIHGQVCMAGTNPTIQFKKNQDNILYDTVYDSVVSVLVVGGFITLFYILCDIGQDLYLFTPMAIAIEQILQLFQISPAATDGIVSGLFEVTRGAVLLSKSGIAISILTPICCFLSSFGGLSILMQCFAFLSPCKIKFSYLLLSKLSHAIISTAICIPLSIFLL